MNSKEFSDRNGSSESATRGKIRVLWVADQCSLVMHYFSVVYIVNFLVIVDFSEQSN